jgi:hypothetical protein
MRIAPPYVPFPFAEDNITTSIAENSIATSGGKSFAVAYEFCSSKQGQQLLQF